MRVDNIYVRCNEFIKRVIVRCAAGLKLCCRRGAPEG